MFIKLFTLVMTLWMVSSNPYILGNGLPLNDFGIRIAQEVGVKYPEKVRVLVTERISADKNIAGMTFGYAIQIKEEYKNELEVYIHELIHVRQYEQMGGIYNFTKEYAAELDKYGYEKAPIEVEAYTISRQLVGKYESYIN